MIVVRCEACGKYHSDDVLIYIQPDVGAFCPDCHSDDLEFLSDRDVLEELNND